MCVTIKLTDMRFRLRFIYKYTHIIEAGGNDKLIAIAERDYTTVSGKSYLLFNILVPCDVLALNL